MRISLRTSDEATARIRLSLVADAYGIFFYVICTAPVDSFEQLGFEDAYTEFRRYLGSDLRFFYDGETCC